MAMDVESTASMWVCLTLSVLLIATRIILRRWRKQSFTHGDYWCMIASLFIIARLIANHLLIIYGSTRTQSASRRIELSTAGHEDEASQVVMGSKIVLVTRTMLVCLLWCLKMAVFDLISNLITNMPYERKLRYSGWGTLFVTFVASIVTIYTDCQPFKLYWQINPDPGDCVVGNVWLMTYEACNIVTDIFLMATVFYIILSVDIQPSQRLRILSLFSIGIFLIAISVVRIVQGRNARSQRSHTLWASLEVLLAAVVAVTPTIYTLIRQRNERRPSAPSRTVHSRTYSGCVKESPKYNAHVWTELHDAGSKGDVTNPHGIRVHTQHEVSNSKV